MATDHNDGENPLGLAREPLAPEALDPMPESTDPSARRRRSRALGEDGIDQHADGLGDVDLDKGGATAIDMGAGGTGNGIEP
jgi:hypothetical protein